MSIAGVTIILVSGLLIWSVEAAARGILRRNGWIGLRFGSFMVSDESWRVGHAAGRVYIWAGGLIFAISGIFAVALPASESVHEIIVFSGTFLLLAAVTTASIVGNRAAGAAVRAMNQR